MVMKKVAILKHLKKVKGSKALGTIVSTATIISTVSDFVSGQKKAKEFEELKETVADLRKAVSELQKKN
jgi:hypothetical protein